MSRTAMSSTQTIAISALVLIATAASGQNKQQTPVRATEQEYVQLASTKALAGTLVSLDSAGKYLTLRVTVPKFERNPSYRPPRTGARSNYSRSLYRSSGGYHPQQHLGSLMSRYQQIARTPNPIQRQIELAQLAMQIQQMEAQAFMQMQMQAARLELQEMQQMARMMQQLARSAGGANNQPFRIVSTPKEFDLELQDNVSVRTMFLPVEFDDMGNAKKHSKAELAERRGSDSIKPGYAAKIDDVQPGDEATLYLLPPRKAADGARPASQRPMVRMLVLTRDRASMSSGKK